MDPAPAASATRNYKRDNDGNDGHPLGEFLTGKYAVTSALQARFINQYDPMYDRPYTHYELNTNRYLDEELCRLLEEDRRNNTQHHLQTDKIEKAFMLALLAHEAILRS
ncbi:uncharacterized protein Tco025E_05567 [Trypanosoma conorhini]|uniref:Uncharacterized protein n=1 Tax=Trypanosoma conorhini TaxID=83891 RepID=A0A422PC48_9TRYP|nr:uncharacterized protein Tco025E_05567 [Trypanosoma conorhini]RNF15297.1 hypothetical protein Tco025E_05567 [Trypanosoma conorhini]